MPTLTLGFVALSGALMGAGFGLSTSLTNRLLLRSLLKEDQAIGSAALLTTRQVGGAVGAALAGVIANMVGFAQGITDATAGGRCAQRVPRRDPDGGAGRARRDGDDAQALIS